MAFIFTCGTHTFQSLLAGYENVTVRCANCGNYSGRVYKRWEWFTFCFIPIIPFSLKPWHEVGCHICHFHQDLKLRPDAQPGAGGQPIPMHNGPGQGWGAQQQPQAQNYGPYYGGGPPQASGAVPAYK